MAAVAARRKDDWLYTVDEDGLITSIRAYWEPERAMATLTRP